MQDVLRGLAHAPATVVFQRVVPATQRGEVRDSRLPSRCRGDGVIEVAAMQGCVAAGKPAV